jgi:hypothetical protein
MANRFWVGGTGTWDNASSAFWSTTSGGASGASVPTLSDTAIFDSNSGSGTVTTSNQSVSTAITVESTTLLLALGTNLTTTNTFTLTRGTISLSTYKLTCAIFASNNTNTRSIDFGTGNIELTASAVNIWQVNNATNFSFTGDPKVYAVANAISGNRNFNHGTSSGSTELNSPSIYVTAGSDTFYFFSARTVDFTGFSGALATGGKYVYGDYTLSPTMSLSADAVNVLQFGSTNATVRDITCNGKTTPQAVLFFGTNGSWRFIDAFNVVSTVSTTLRAGTLNANGQNVNIGSFALGSGTKTLTLGSGTWTVAGSGTAWNANTNVANLTVSASTGTINMSSASAKTFAGGAKVWPTLNQGGAGALTIEQSNTFANITNTVQPATITLTASTTQTVSAFGISGTANNLITLNSSVPGSQATLSDSSGTINVTCVSIKDNNATGGATWNAYVDENNIDAGNVDGWNFGLSPVVGGAEYTYTIRSFTQPRRF